MNAFLRITVRVVNAGAADLKAVQKGVDEITRSAGRGGVALRQMQHWTGFQRLEKFGKDVQWTGRQIEYRLTLPLLAAGLAAGRWSNANEAAFTRLTKVYGSFADGAARNLHKELTDLRRSFEVLSDIFGVQQSEVLGIAADWAQAGAQGIALARATRLTLEAMVLGELEAGAAGQALISIMMQYGQTTDELRNSLGILNVVENETAISMAGLIDVLERSAGVARSAGIDIRTLAALAAALVPATGSASTAGNGLRTIISRLLAPTKQAADVLKAMGLNIDSVAWLSQNGQQRLESLARAFEGLTQNQKAVVSAFVASRFQINRFDVLMRDIVNPVGNYQKALRSTADQQRVMLQYQRELGQVLSSQPQAFKILTAHLQNALARVIVPMIPAVLALADRLAKLVDAFTRLDPALQQLVLFGLAALALLGPFLAYLGTFATVIGAVGRGLHFFFIGSEEVASGLSILFGVVRTVGGAVLWLATKPLHLLGLGFDLVWSAVVRVGALLASLVGGWPFAIGVALALAIALIVRFRHRLGRVVVDTFAVPIDLAKRAFDALPSSVRRALLRVYSVIKGAALAIYDALSYINPFARHSPSLVEQVQAGVDIIAARYASLRNIGQIFRAAVADLRAFGQATEAARNSLTTAERAEQRQAIVASAGPQGGAAFDRLVRGVDSLRPVLDGIGQEFIRQEAVVAKWEQALRDADAAVDAARASLDQLQAAANDARDQLDAARSALDELKDAPIEGMAALNEQIFQNELAQKKLRLEMLRMEQAGRTIDDIKNKMAGLQGSIEELHAQQAELRLAGAGSDVLGPIQDQIAAMEQARSELGAQAAPIDAIQQQLEELQRQGEILGLVYDTTFDPLTRQIEQATSAMHEMPFDQLLAQIQQQQAGVTRLTAIWDQADAAVLAQQAEVDRLTAARDQVKAVYDAEKKSLDELGAAYDGVEQQIREMEGAVGDLIAASERAAKGSNFAVDQFNAAGLADFAAPGGKNVLGFEEGDIGKLADQWAQEARKSFGSLDIFGPVREGWRKAWRWVRDSTAPLVSPVGDAIRTSVSGVAALFDGGFAPAVQRVKQRVSEIADHLQAGPLGTAVEGVRSMFGSLGDALSMTWGLIGDEVRELVGLVVGFVVDLITAVGDELENWGPMWTLFGDAVQNIASFVGIVLAVLANDFKIVLGVILLAWSIAWPVLINVLKPVLDMAVGLVRAGLEIMRGVIAFVLAVIGGEWGKAWQAVLTVLDGIWDAIYAVLKGAAGLVAGLVVGIVKAIGEAWGGIVDVFRKPVNWVIENVINRFISAVERLADALDFKLNLPRLPLVGEDMTGSGGGGAGAPHKLHTGGIVPGWNEVPATLLGGEGVLPRNVMARLGRQGFQKLRLGETDALVPYTDEKGGPFDWVRDRANDVLGAGRKLIGATVRPIVEGALALMDKAIGRFGGPGRLVAGVAHRVGDGALKWISGVDGEAKKKLGSIPPGDPPYERLISYIRGSGVAYRVTSTYRAGDPGYHGQGRAADFAGPSPSWDSPALLAIYRAFLPITDQLKELIYSGPGAPSYKNGSPYGYPADLVADHHDHVHAALQYGGIVKRSPGGTLVRLGEGRFDERVSQVVPGQPEPAARREFHFHGDLSFPSVRNGDDAKKFIENLESLVH